MKLTNNENSVIRMVLEWCSRKPQSKYVYLQDVDEDGEVFYWDESQVAEDLIVASRPALEEWIEKEWAQGRQYYALGGQIYVRSIPTEMVIERLLGDKNETVGYG